MNLTGILAVLCALLAVACWFLWRGWDTAADARDRAQDALQLEASNAKVVTQYVDRVVQVPGPAVVRDRIVRGLCIIPSVPSAAGTDGTAGADPAYRLPDGAGKFAGRLSVELAAVKRNRLKAEALQDVLRPQVDQ
jgi:hypothetical protein